MRTTRDGDAAIIQLSGELDMASCPELEAAIRDAEESEIGAVVIDLRELEFMDSVSLSLLLDAQKRSKTDGGRLSFIAPEQEEVIRLLAITRTAETLLN